MLHDPPFLHSPPHPVTVAAQVVQPLAGVPCSLILVWTRKSSMSTIGVLPAVRGTAHDSSIPKHPFNPPWVAADYSIEQGHPGSGRLSAQPQDPVLQHVKRTTDSVLGQRLSSCLKCSPYRQLAMPGGMPASARQADKGAAASAVPASLLG